MAHNSVLWSAILLRKRDTHLKTWGVEGVKVPHFIL